MLLPLVAATLALTGPSAAVEATAAPVAARCAYSLGVILQPPGLVDVYQYPYAGGKPRRDAKLATANLRGGAISSLCTRVKALTPPARPRGLAGPWPRRVESRVYCGEGGTVQIRSIVSKGRVVGTRLLVMRKDVEAPTIHAHDGRHVSVEVVLRPKTGGISFDPAYCDRSTIG